MDTDDGIVGRILGRREAMRLLALGSAATFVGCRRGAAVASDSVVAAGSVARNTAALPGCVVRPELTVGPYFVDRQLERSDIRAEPTTGALRAGVPVAVSFNVMQVGEGRCAPLPGAMVDVWQCDAAGSYSGVTDEREGFATAGQKFLRGYQVTDASGVARFTTIYPGWYRGRAVHIHFKIRAPASAALAGNMNGTYEFTSQLFFDDALTDQVHTRAPYAAKGMRDRRNSMDGIYRQVGGDQLVLATTAAEEGYRASFDIGLDLSDVTTGRADRAGGLGGRRRRPDG